MIQPGQTIPDYLGVDEEGREYTRQNLQGQKVVLYFYPKDNTSGCTAEACSLRDGWDAIRAKGYTIIGVSKDSARSHTKFKADHNLPFPLITDPDSRLQEAFGVWVEKKMYGRTYFGTLRATFLIDETGTIRHAMSGKEIKTSDHANQILQAIDQL